MTIPQNMLNVLKQELGFGDKEMPSLNMNEKVCVYFLLFFFVARFNRLAVRCPFLFCPTRPTTCRFTFFHHDIALIRRFFF